VKILVADDHALIREAFRHLLTELDPGVTVLEAGDGDGACRLIAQHPDLDLVLLDLRLPGAGGLVTLEKLRGQRVCRKTLVLSMTDPM
jgi:DNA-binding NarL/FixJ family response regulator